MNCKSCGTKIPIGAPYCPNCGKATLDVTVWQNTEEQKKGPAKSVQSNASPRKKVDAAREVSLIVAFEGLLASFAGLFLPFFEVRIFGKAATIPLWSEKFLDTSILFVVTLVIGSVCMVTFDKGKGFPQVAAGATILAITLLTMFYNLKSLEEENLNSLVEKGDGFYLLVIGGVLLINSGMILNVMRTRGTRQ